MRPLFFLEYDRLQTGRLIVDYGSPGELLRLNGKGGMMNGDLLAVFEYLEKEKGISRDVLIEAVSSSIISAAKKSVGDVDNLVVEIDKETGDIRAYREVKVVEKVAAADSEISLDEAVKIKPDAKLGDTLRKQFVAKRFGRIAAQTAKQVIIQRIREAEHEIVYNEYKDRVGEIVTAVVRRYERGNVILDMGKAEAVLPPREQCPREGYGVGRRLTVYIVEVNETPKGPEIVVSRSHPELLRKLFELEVPEISEGVVEIKGVARDPGFRSKIAVATATEKVDAVGACVGMRGARVKNVVRELSGEKVDIVRWNEDRAAYITNALSPAKPREVTIYDDNRAEIIIDDDQFSLAVGKKGHGARLIARLTGMKIDLKKQSEAEREKREAHAPLEELEGLGKKVMATLREGGYGTVGDVRKVTISDLLKLPGIGEKTAQKIILAASQFILAEEREKEAAGDKEKPEEEASPREADAEGEEVREGTEGETPAASEDPAEPVGDRPQEPETGEESAEPGNEGKK